MSIDKFLRAQVAVILFAGAYIAEIIRGGLQSLPKGQFEAADAMGLNYCPEDDADHPAAGAARGDPAADQHLHRLLQGHLAGADHRHLRLPEHRQPGAGRSQLGGFPGEVYLFAAFVYFCFCFSMSRYSKYLEIELNKGTPLR